MTIASPPSPSSSSGTASVPAPASPLPGWTRKHLLGLEELSADEIMAILDTATPLAEISTAAARRFPHCKGASFSTSSSRTRHARAPASAWPPSGCPPTPRTSPPAPPASPKERSFIDTAKNIEAMGADVMVVRHPTPGRPTCWPST